MTSVLILCAHRPNRSPSQRYRFEQYLSLLEKKGFHFTFSYLLNEKEDKIFYSKGHLIYKIFILLKSFFIRLKDLRRFKNFKIIFIQREAFFLGTSFFERKAAYSGAYVIFDFDDSIWLADTSPGNKKWEWLKSPGKFFDTISAAQCVLAGNSYLAERAKAFNKNTYIIPTTINTLVHLVNPELRNKEVLNIGWSGSVSTVKHFELIIPVLLKIQERYNDRVSFTLFGDACFTHPHLKVKAIAWTENSEVTVLNSFDIGLMPLPDDEWAKGKCGLKGLSYMACGVPTVMSAVGVNKEIIQQGENGFLASTEEEWFRFLCLLIEDKALREKTGLKGRQTVVEKFSVEATKELYFEVFKKAST